MKKIILLLAILTISCGGKKDPPLVIPPNFNELPDPKNPEKIDEQNQDADIKKLKELLLKSE